MEFLVHNTSHSDLVVELSWIDAPASTASSDAAADSTATPSVTAKDGTNVPLTFLARPKFSLFQPISHSILRQVQNLRSNEEKQNDNSSRSAFTSVSNGNTSMSVSALKPSFMDTTEESSDTIDSSLPDWVAFCSSTKAPVGFHLRNCPIPVTDLQSFRVRGDIESVELIQKYWGRVAITAVYFPLVAVIIPKWEQVLSQFHSRSSKQLLYMISGAGIPRNSSHSMQGNSTEITAQLITLFLHQCYPSIEVNQVHSGSNIFRYDDNVQFMTRELRPRLEAQREILVERSGESWKSHFHVTIAYADGPPARLSALNASLRIYQPSYLHAWQLKTFWHRKQLSMDDVDFHSFQNIEAAPSISVDDADDMTKKLVLEMQGFRDQFLNAEHEGEVLDFWLRKSKKPVLAVLLIEKPGKDGQESQIVVSRGMNCEVSMPTGSLCAERNAIGSALAKDPTLTRRSLKMIGVLGLNLSNSKSSTPNGGKEEAKQEVEEPLVPITVSEAEAEAVDDDESPGSEVEPGKRRKRRLINMSNSSPLRKPKRPRTFSCDEISIAGLQDHADVHDRNPLAPCGACKEWLLKIAEANPSFRIVTFESVRCDNFYIHQLM